MRAFPLSIIVDVTENQSLVSYAIYLLWPFLIRPSPVVCYRNPTPLHSEGIPGVLQAPPSYNFSQNAQGSQIVTVPCACGALQVQKTIRLYNTVYESSGKTLCSLTHPSFELTYSFVVSPTLSGMCTRPFLINLKHLQQLLNQAEMIWADKFQGSSSSSSFKRYFALCLGTCFRREDAYEPLGARPESAVLKFSKTTY